MVRITIGGGVAVGCLVFGLSAAGCDSSGRVAKLGGPDGPTVVYPETLTGIDLIQLDAGEVDLVEALVSHRSQYHRLLHQLRDYYVTKGYAAKAEWASFELGGLGRVKQFLYLLDAEVPTEAIRSDASVPEADALYLKGLDLMRRGGHGVPAVYRTDRMVEAGRVFRQLIDQYGTSDKVDDAAFYLGEIHSAYLKGQEQLAVRWYERAFTWDPSTPHPARFQAAVVYDERLHDRARSLELYQKVIEHETDHPSNVRHAARRVRELSSAGRAPGSSTGG